jgi:hypothetical protein
MTRPARLAAWVWDNCPVPAQNLMFDRAPRLAARLEGLAWQRDRVNR